ncbi:MAG TPA: phosphate signaling complex protein PhoU [Steroidobacteraceae bacterium]|jgi:phosphate transport system protein|nr:phosphate signaling complex protein PhoU [Steroidobacteraceae bacterium]
MQAADISHHTSRRYNHDLESVRSKVLAMGGFVEDQLSRSLLALIDADSSLGRAVASDDCKVNGMELSIDEECSRILATRAPAAGDLRMVVATIKAITDLERIGDECEKVGLIAAKLATLERPADRYREVKHLGRRVQVMVRDTLDAFARLDATSALETARTDRAIDEQYEAIQRQCVADMVADPDSIHRSIETMWAVRSLERIGDHAKNICEYVIYMVHGKDIRHTSLDHVARELAQSALLTS